MSEDNTENMETEAIPVIGEGAENAETPEQTFLDIYKNADEFSKASLQKLMSCAKQSAVIPSASDDWDYYSSFPIFHKIMKAEQKKIRNLMGAILKHDSIKGSIPVTDVEDSYDFLVDANDLMLDRVNCYLDEAVGTKKKPELVVVSSEAKPVNTSWNRKIHDRRSSLGKSYSLLTAKNIPRPQLSFRNRVDNSANSPFIPNIQMKPNNKKPLSLLPEVGDHGEFYAHPYEYELEHYTPQPSQLTVVEPQLPPPLQDTPLLMITKPEQVQELVDSLRSSTEISVDLEAHSYRTYLGLTCLMQLSTRSTDYIIDTLALRDDLQLLNEIFTHPKIVKVFHGSDSDILWLQRCLGLYVVNLFDTHIASTVLSLPHHSLAYLLSHYCQVEANKQYQLADWRIRPLPEELIKYGREDSHYLLYIYDLMKNQLLERGNQHKNLLHAVLTESNNLCLQRYEKPVVNESSYIPLYKKSKKMFNTRQLNALTQIYAWRDKTARIEDESPGYVLPTHMLLQIAEVLPREMQGILACCNPTPPLVKQNLLQLHQIILIAREQSLVQTCVDKDTEALTEMRPPIDFNSHLYCPHERGAASQTPTKLPTLLTTDCSPADKPTLDKKLYKQLISKNPKISAFNSQDKPTADTQSRVDSLLSVMVSLSPFQRYTRVQPILEAQRAQEEEKQRAAERDEIQKEKVASEARIHRLQEHFQSILSPEEGAQVAGFRAGMGAGRKRPRYYGEEQDTQTTRQYAPGDATPTSRKPKAPAEKPKPEKYQKESRTWYKPTDTPAATTITAEDTEQGGGWNAGEWTEDSGAAAVKKDEVDTDESRGWYKPDEATEKLLQPMPSHKSPSSKKTKRKQATEDLLTTVTSSQTEPVCKSPRVEEVVADDRSAEQEEGSYISTEKTKKKKAKKHKKSSDSSGGVEVEAFDYSKADYSVFKPGGVKHKKKKNKSKDGGEKEKKGKSSPGEKLIKHKSSDGEGVNKHAKTFFHKANK